MKKLILSILILSSALGFHSCSEDFAVSAPYKDITVVYGLLNMQDTAHYIRIQKAFLDENRSAIEMSKVADSSFYNQLDVRVKEISGTTVVNNIQLQRVNMEDEGYPKEPGAFFTAPNYSYKFAKPLNANYRYRLVITHSSTGNVDSAEIDILDTSALFVSSFSQPGGYIFNFPKTYPEALAKYQLFVTPGAKAEYIEGLVRFNWIDSNLVTGSQTPMSATHIFASKPKDGKPLEAMNIGFYSFLREAMGPAPENIIRLMDSSDFYIYTGGADYHNYIRTIQIQSGGLTSDLVKPIYTNLKGKDVYGIFSSRAYKVKFNVPIGNETIDSLRTNTITVPARIRGRAHQ